MIQGRERKGKSVWEHRPRLFLVLPSNSKALTPPHCCRDEASLVLGWIFLLSTISVVLNRRVSGQPLARAAGAWPFTGEGPRCEECQARHPELEDI